MYVESLKSHAQSGSLFMFSCFPAHRIGNSLKESILKSSVHMVMMLHTGMRENKITICPQVYDAYFYPEISKMFSYLNSFSLLFKLAFAERNDYEAH